MELAHSYPSCVPSKDILKRWKSHLPPAVCQHTDHQGKSGSKKRKRKRKITGEIGQSGAFEEKKD
ncbi:hypothetical protein F2P79_021454 [Pimephales promelas]|nr:hypothetical protein F2P79_021454 [Pimephales promelas]